MNWIQELDSALRAARSAAKLINDRYVQTERKASAAADITTQTDRDSQDAIISALAADFPDDAFRAEEQTSLLLSKKQQGSRLWIIDPIDGTRGFVMKNGEFSVMIALAVDGIPVVGVVAEPAHDRLTYATQAGGCWIKTGDSAPKQTHVTATNQISSSTLIQSHTKPEKGLTNEVRVLGPQRVIETYSAGVKLARVADGTADLYVCDYAAMNDWDLAAGHILVTEAGGRVSNLAGETRTYGRESPKQLGGLLATNGWLHNAVIQRLATRALSGSS